MNYNKYFVRVHLNNEPDLIRYAWDNTMYTNRMHSDIMGPHADTVMYAVHMTEEEAVILKLSVPVIGNIVYCSKAVV